MPRDRGDTENLHDAFDLLASDWDAGHGPSSWRGRAFQTRIGYLRSTCRHLGRPRVVDLGCATGHHLLALSDAIAEGVGIDVAPGMIARARQNAARLGIGNVDFREGDATAIAALERGPFDLVISVCTIEHVAAPQDLIAGAHRLLRPDGELLVMTLHPSNPMALLYRLLGGIRRLPPARHLAPAELYRIGEDGGFRLRCIRDFPYTAHRHLRWPDEEGVMPKGLVGSATVLTGAYAAEFERR